MAGEWIVRELATRVESRPLPEVFRPVVLPADDEPDHDGEVLGYAEGQTFMIEYRDAKGATSRRRITVFDIISGSAGIPALRARCHERKATRQFRVDRIVCCIDYSGEIHDDVASFLHENFGMGSASASAREDDATASMWPRVLEVIRDDAILLSAMAKADGSFSDAELHTIVDYLSGRVERSVKFLTPREVEAIRAYVRRLRPGAESLSRSVNNIIQQGSSRIEEILRAKVRVMDADGRRHPQEVELLNRIANEFIGVHVA